MAGPAIAAEGGLDQSFAKDGHADLRMHDTPSGQTLFSFDQTDVALHRRGKILTVGTVEYQDKSLFGVFRLLADGRLDTAFGTGGWAMLDLGHSARPEAVAVDRADRILVAGKGGCGCFTVVRFLPDGTLDTTFGNEGISRTRFFANGSVAFSWARALAIGPDGKLTVAGFKANDWGDESVAVARLRRNGRPDLSFSDDGRASLNWGFVHNEARAVAVRRDGSAVVVGTAQRNYERTGDDFVVLQYRPDGRLDPRFSGDGKAHVNFGRQSSDEANDARLVDGKLVIVGSSTPRNMVGTRMATARLTRAGALDRTFSRDGRRLIGFEDRGARANVGLVDSRGRVILAGGLYDHAADTVRWVVVRLRHDGSRDALFGRRGVRRPYFWPSEDYATSGLVRPDGKLVFGGNVLGGHGVVRMTGS